MRLFAETMSKSEFDRRLDALRGRTREIEEAAAEAPSGWSGFFSANVGGQASDADKREMLALYNVSVKDMSHIARLRRQEELEAWGRSTGFPLSSFWVKLYKCKSFVKYTFFRPLGSIYGVFNNTRHFIEAIALASSATYGYFKDDFSMLFISLLGTTALEFGYYNLGFGDFFQGAKRILYRVTCGAVGDCLNGVVLKWQGAIQRMVDGKDAFVAFCQSRVGNITGLFTFIGNINRNAEKVAQAATNVFVAGGIACAFYGYDKASYGLFAIGAMQTLNKYKQLDAVRRFNDITRRGGKIDQVNQTAGRKVRVGHEYNQAHQDWLVLQPLLNVRDPENMTEAQVTLIENAYNTWQANVARIPDALNG